MERLVILKKLAKCQFCGQKKIDHLKYGPLYKLGKVTAHYFCVLLSNRLIQNGSDEEGILGFLLPDILNELKRTSNINCTYCKKKNATIQCAHKNCRRSFHLHCGLEKGSSHQFSDDFKSFCHLHGYFQNIPYKILEEAIKTKVICCICHEKVDVQDKHKTLWAPCCMKTWYHKFCLQELANSAGYFFKCAACNNVQKFNRCMQRFGIFVPQQDASWETVPNAFAELLFKYGTCDAEICKCPYGRQKNDIDTEWEVIVCSSCGSQGIHVNCGNLKNPNLEWECSGCEKVTKNMRHSVAVCDPTKEDPGSSVKLMELSHKRKRRGSEDIENIVLDKRKKSRTNVEEDGEEMEIDVETVDEEPKKNEVNEVKEIIDVEDDEVTESSKVNIRDGFKTLKPGPLSYKLSMIRKTYPDKLTSFQKHTKGPERTSSPEVIDITEVDEEKLPGGDVEIIEENSKQLPGGDVEIIEESSKQLPGKHCSLLEVRLEENEVERNDRTDLGAKDPQELVLEIAGRNRNEPEDGLTPSEKFPETHVKEFINLPMCISSSVKNENEVIVLDCKLNKSDMINEKKKAIEEEVIIIDNYLKKFDIQTVKTFDNDIIIID